jgi:HEAT repeat protein
METEPSPKITVQPPLFNLGEASKGLLELFPEVWNAAEDLTSPNSAMRRLAIEKLERMRAARFSPLAAYLIATHVTDPDMEVRARVIKILGEVLTPDEQGGVITEDVRVHLVYFLTHMRTRQIYAILQAAAIFPETFTAARRLLEVCPHAGNHLVDIASSRKAPLDVRRLAIRLIGEIGYLDAIPALERMRTRMETRFNGQQAMPFAPPYGVDDSGLLPDVRSTLAALHSP